ncbi:MAG: hypothetical protein JXA71_00860 [Chitinispirillaceae bacterium]|nr:hypothetical protein [Chitinispirillaceae bacterium]
MNASYTKPTGQPHKIKVDSSLIYALWNCGIAHAGTETPFIVRTALVGEGAEIKVRLKDDKGKTLEKMSGKVLGNCCRASIAIPENVRMDAMLHLEVELPKHGLDGESNRIPAGPSLKPRSMQWSKKETKRGDVLKLQAQFVDLPDNTDAEVTIYEFDKDGNHDPLITLPTVIKNSALDLSWEYQYQDETDRIPTQTDLKPYQKKYKQPQYFYVIEIDGCRIGTGQESGLLKFNDAITLSLADPDGTARADETYRITFADGTEKKGTLDAEGKASIDMPPGPFTVEYGV